MNQHLFTIASLLLYTVISQAAPMVNNPTQLPAEVVVPKPESLLSPPAKFQLQAIEPSVPISPPPSLSPQLPAALSVPFSPRLHPPTPPSQYNSKSQYHPQLPPPLPPPHPQYNLQAQNEQQQHPQPQHHSQFQPQPPQLPENCTPCPPDCQQLQQPPKKKTGWRNGFTNLFNYLYNAFYDTFVGERGILTNLAYKRKASRTKLSKSDATSGNSNAKACCIFYKNPPPVQDQPDKEPDGTENPPDLQIPQINCMWIRNRSNSAPEVSPAASLVPGATTNTKSNQNNCCCVGKELFNVSRFVKAHIAPHFNCLSVSMNVQLVDA